MDESGANSDIIFEFCDFSNEEHLRNFAGLVNEYISDPMGGGEPLTQLQQLRLVDGMANHPSGFVIFAIQKDLITGLVTCFVNFSTFKAKNYLYIHDIIVREEFRGKGIGRQLIQKCIDIATEREYCKVTLEVRSDNTVAKRLYESFGFRDTDPMMHFWTREL